MGKLAFMVLVLVSVASNSAGTVAVGLLLAAFACAVLMFIVSFSEGSR